MTPRSLGISALLLTAACASSAPREEAPVASSPVASTDATSDGAARPVELELWAMSQCPYAISFEDTLLQVASTLGSSVSLRVQFIGVVEDGALESMHGPEEVAGDMAQLCAQQHGGRWLELASCQNEDPDLVATNWKPCAERLGLPVAAIAKCIASDEGRSLLRASFERAQQLGISGSPTVLINGARYEGARRPISVARALCEAQVADKAPVCATIPPIPEVKVTLLEDTRCAECQGGLEEAVRNRIEKPLLSSVDYDTPSGRELYAAIGGGLLPALVFDASLLADEGAAQTFSRRRAVGDRLVVEAGSFNPRCVDAGGCALDECKPVLSCRKETPRKVELYTMSKCPFCAEAVQALPEVLDNFKKAGADVDLSIHFIGAVASSGELSSMRGEPEVAEDLRQACAQAHYAKNRKYLDYLVCRAKSFRSDDWQSCTGKKIGIDAAVLTKCVEGAEGPALLSASFTYAKRAGVRASPTFVINDKHKRSTRFAEPIKQMICEHNALAGCDKSLSGGAALPQGSQ